MILAAAATLLVAAAQAPLELAITIDDLPMHAPYPPGVTPDAVSRQMISALKAGGVPVTGFVNAVRMQEQPGTASVLDRWHAAGAVLGNHGWAHRSLSDMTVEEFEEELVKDEPALLRHGAGTDWHWFSYSFLD